MNPINPNEMLIKIILIIPIPICLFFSYLIKSINGNIISGFNTLSESKKQELREKGYVDKTRKMTYIMTIPLIVAFISSFIVKNSKIFNYIMMSAWGVFALIVIIGIVFINISVKK